VPLFLPPGDQFLGSTKLASGALTTNTVSFGAYDILVVHFTVAGYAGSDIAGFRFNGDTGSNYLEKISNAASASTAWTVTNPTAGTRMQVSATAVTAGRVGTMVIQNITANRKECWIQTATDPGSAAAPIADSIFGLWSNTTAQITSMVMITPTSNMNAGTGFAVWGINL
jgi:hypothetical protein